MSGRPRLSGRSTDMGINGICKAILDEVHSVVSKISSKQTQKVICHLLKAKRIYITGVGRSGLVVKAFGQRLMHLGFEVHLADEITAPGIRKDDVLIACSGTGRTQLVLYMAKKAQKIGAKVIAITGSPASALAKYADQIIYIPAPLEQYEKRANIKTSQPARSLFEQAMFIYLEAVIMQLMRERRVSKEKIESRHANLE